MSSNGLKPIFVKIPPYYDDENQNKILNLVRIAKEIGIDGITATNTKPIKTDKLAVGKGGLSGHSLMPDTLRLISEIRSEIGSSMIINLDAKPAERLIATHCLCPPDMLLIAIFIFGIFIPVLDKTSID